jgi:peptide chain release factor 2
MSLSSASPRRRSFFDPSKVERDKIQAETQKPEVWNDQEKFRDLNKKLALLDERLDALDMVRKAIDDADVLVDFSKDDESQIPDLQSALKDVAAKLDDIEIKNLLSGKHDQLNCFLSFSSGAGGVDAQDWTEMLMRMYTRWATNHDFKVTIEEYSPGDEAGVKSATLKIDGAYAFGFLKSEKGVHRLVRISPFDTNHRRHTSFSLVEVLPELPPAEEIQINPDDIRVDTFNASGHGGQNVQKNDTAVRVTHFPSGLVVACQNERSQGLNRAMAMKILSSRLQALQEEQIADEEKKMRGPRVSIEWGNQIRSYVLQPYTLVKDNRTSIEIGNANKVLEGDLDEFIWGYLKAQLKK